MSAIPHAAHLAAAVPVEAREGLFIPFDGVGALVPTGYPGLRPIFEAATPRFARWIALADGYAAAIGRIHAEAIAAGDAPVVRFGQEWFPRLDAVAAYVMVREARPRRIVEIGCGHSTRFLARAIADGRLGTDLVCIDPAPRARLDGVAATHLRRRFGEADVTRAATLEAGDILFIDSSHVAMPGTEVDRLMLDVLPRLRPGVLVHVHDIFLPERYPAAWDRRGYNEQLLVGALLQGGAWALEFASRYVTAATRLVEGTVIERLPLAPDAYECSLWMRKAG